MIRNQQVAECIAHVSGPKGAAGGSAAPGALGCVATNNSPGSWTVIANPVPLPTNTKPLTDADIFMTITAAPDGSGVAGGVQFQVSGSSITAGTGASISAFQNVAGTQTAVDTPFWVTIWRRVGNPS